MKRFVVLLLLVSLFSCDRVPKYKYLKMNLESGWFDIVIDKPISHSKLKILGEHIRKENPSHKTLRVFYGEKVKE